MQDLDDVSVATRFWLGLLTDAELSVTLEVTAGTLEVWRGQGKGPAWVKLGKRVFYRLTDVRKWIDASKVEPRIGGTEEHMPREIPWPGKRRTP